MKPKQTKLVKAKVSLILRLTFMNTYSHTPPHIHSYIHTHICLWRNFYRRSEVILTDRVLTLDKIVCVSLRVNSFKKGIYLPILLPTMC